MIYEVTSLSIKDMGKVLNEVGVIGVRYKFFVENKFVEFIRTEHYVAYIDERGEEVEIDLTEEAIPFEELCMFLDNNVDNVSSLETLSDAGNVNNDLTYYTY